MSDAALGTAPPADLLTAHPATAYLWGQVAAAGSLDADGLSVTAGDEATVERLRAVLGATPEADGAAVDHETAARSFAHDAAVTRYEDEYVLRVPAPDLAARASAAFGLPRGDAAGGYRLGALAAHDRPLLRGLFDGCGVVCFRESAASVGVSFVHDDRALLERTRRLLSDAAPGFESDPVADASDGGGWFGVADDEAAAFVEWVYDGSDASGLYAPDRRTKARRSVERARSLAEGADGPAGVAASTEDRPG